MNGTVEESLKLIAELQHKLPQSGVEVVIAPPFTALYSASVILQETAIKLGAQNMHWESEGAFTGEISGIFLKEVGCTFVLIGHSERRQYFGETDANINRKILAALTQEISPVFCIGETLEQRQSKKTESILSNQLKAGLSGVPMGEALPIVIAYEPVWAIGSGKTPTPEEIGETQSFIRNYLAKTYDAPTANQMRLLYGGSVSAENAKDILHSKNVDGVLVGGASLVMDKFLKIIQSAEA